MSEYKKMQAHGLKVCQTHITFWPGHISPVGDGTMKIYIPDIRKRNRADCQNALPCRGDAFLF